MASIPYSSRVLVATDTAGRQVVAGQSLLLSYLALGVLFCVLAVRVWVRIDLIETAYEIENLRTATVQLDSHLRETQSQYAAETKPAVVTQRAVSSLQMMPLPLANRRQLAAQ